MYQVHPFFGGSMMAFRIGLGILLVVVLAGCGSSNSTPTTPTTPQPLTVTIVSAARTLGVAAYTPNPATVTAGAKLTCAFEDVGQGSMLMRQGDGERASRSQVDLHIQR